MEKNNTKNLFIVSGLIFLVAVGVFYFLILPVFLYFLSSFSSKRQEWLERFVFIYIFTIYSIGFFISCADIPWYRQFETRITAASLQWTNTLAMMLKIVLEDVRNYPFLIAFVLLIFFFFMQLVIILLHIRFVFII